MEDEAQPNDISGNGSHRVERSLFGQNTGFDFDAFRAVLSAGLESGRFSGRDTNLFDESFLASRFVAALGGNQRAGAWNARLRRLEEGGTGPQYAALQQLNEDLTLNPESFNSACPVERLVDALVDILADKPSRRSTKAVLKCGSSVRPTARDSGGSENCDESWELSSDGSDGATAPEQPDGAPAGGLGEEHSFSDGNPTGALSWMQDGPPISRRMLASLCLTMLVDVVPPSSLRLASPSNIRLLSELLYQDRCSSDLVENVVSIFAEIAKETPAELLNGENTLIDALLSSMTRLSLPLQRTIARILSVLASTVKTPEKIKIAFEPSIPKLMKLLRRDDDADVLLSAASVLARLSESLSIALRANDNNNFEGPVVLSMLRSWSDADLVKILLKLLAKVVDRFEELSAKSIPESPSNNSRNVGCVTALESFRLLFDILRVLSLVLYVDGNGVIEAMKLDLVRLLHRLCAVTGASPSHESLLFSAILAVLVSALPAVSFVKMQPDAAHLTPAKLLATSSIPPEVFLPVFRSNQDRCAVLMSFLTDLFNKDGLPFFVNLIGRELACGTGPVSDESLEMGITFLLEVTSFCRWLHAETEVAHVHIPQLLRAVPPGPMGFLLKSCMICNSTSEVSDENLLRDKGDYRASWTANLAVLCVALDLVYFEVCITPISRRIADAWERCSLRRYIDYLMDGTTTLKVCNNDCSVIRLYYELWISQFGLSNELLSHNRGPIMVDLVKGCRLVLQQLGTLFTGCSKSFPEIQFSRVRDSFDKAKLVENNAAKLGFIRQAGTELRVFFESTVDVEYLTIPFLEYNIPHDIINAFSCSNTFEAFLDGFAPTLDLKRVDLNRVDLNSSFQQSVFQPDFCKMDIGEKTVNTTVIQDLRPLLLLVRITIRSLESILQSLPITILTQPSSPSWVPPHLRYAPWPAAKLAPVLLQQFPQDIASRILQLMSQSSVNTGPADTGTAKRAKRPSTATKDVQSNKLSCSDLTNRSGRVRGLQTTAAAAEVSRRTESADGKSEKANEVDEACIKINYPGYKLQYPLWTRYSSGFTAAFSPNALFSHLRRGMRLFGLCEVGAHWPAKLSLWTSFEERCEACLRDFFGDEPAVKIAMSYYKEKWDVDVAAKLKLLSDICPIQSNGRVILNVTPPDLSDTGIACDLALLNRPNGPVEDDDRSEPSWRFLLQIRVDIRSTVQTLEVSLQEMILKKMASATVVLRSGPIVMNQGSSAESEEGLSRTTATSRVALDSKLHVSIDGVIVPKHWTLADALCRYSAVVPVDEWSSSGTDYLSLSQSSGLLQDETGFASSSIGLKVNDKLLEEHSSWEECSEAEDDNTIPRKNDDTEDILKDLGSDNKKAEGVTVVTPTQSEGAWFLVQDGVPFTVVRCSHEPVVVIRNVESSDPPGETDQTMDLSMDDSVATASDDRERIRKALTATVVDPLLVSSNHRSMLSSSMQYTSLWASICKLRIGVPNKPFPGPDAVRAFLQRTQKLDHVYILLKDLLAPLPVLDSSDSNAAPAKRVGKSGDEGSTPVLIQFRSASLDTSVTDKLDAILANAFGGNLPTTGQSSTNLGEAGNAEAVGATTVRLYIDTQKCNEINLQSMRSEKFGDSRLTVTFGEKTDTAHIADDLISLGHVLRYAKCKEIMQNLNIHDPEKAFGLETLDSADMDQISKVRNYLEICAKSGVASSIDPTESPVMSNSVSSSFTQLAFFKELKRDLQKASFPDPGNGPPSYLSCSDFDAAVSPVHFEGDPEAINDSVLRAGKLPPTRLFPRESVLQSDETDSAGDIQTFGSMKDVISDSVNGSMNENRTDQVEKTKEGPVCVFDTRMRRPGDEFVHSEHPLPSKACRVLLHLLRVLCRSIRSLASRNIAVLTVEHKAVTRSLLDMGAPGPGSPSPRPLILLSEHALEEIFASSMLATLVQRHICDPIAIAGSRLPSWLPVLVEACPYLLPFWQRRIILSSKYLGALHGLNLFKDRMISAAAATGLRPFGPCDQNFRQVAFATTQKLESDFTDLSAALQVLQSAPAIHLTSESPPPPASEPLDAFVAAVSMDVLFLSTARESKIRRRIFEANQLLQAPRLKLKVSRERILDAAMHVLNTVQLQSVAAGQPLVLDVQYEGEEGVGVGPTLEFFTQVVDKLRNLRNPELFTITADGRTVFPKPFPLKIALLTPELVQKPIVDLSKTTWLHTDHNSHSSTEGEQTRRLFALWRMLGQLFAKAILDQRLLPLRLHPSFWQLVLTPPYLWSTCTAADEEMLPLIAPSLAVHLKTLRELVQKGESLEDLCLSFIYPGLEQIELIEGGRSITVTKSNFTQYASLLARWTLLHGIAFQVYAFRFGVATLMPLEALKLFTPYELAFGLVSGVEPTDTNEFWDAPHLKQYISADHGFTDESQDFKDFLEVLTTLNVEERRLFLQFCTGAPVLPRDGFAGLRPTMRIVKKESSDSENEHDYPLPSVMACSNYVKLPAYPTKEIMREKLLFALREGQNAFALS